MIRLNPRWIGFVAATAIVACSGSVTVGSDASGTPSSDASARGDGAPSDPCAGQPVPLVACDPGPTALTCNTSVSPPRWDLVCPGAGSGNDAGTPCDGLGAPDIACDPGPGHRACNTSVSPPRWDLVCPGTGKDAGSPCDGLGVITIGCASGQPIYTCNTSDPSPRWDVTCPPPAADGCCPAGYQLSASGEWCIATCAAGQACPALAVQPRCLDAGASDGAVSASDSMPPPDTGVCCPAGWLLFSCQYPDGGAAFACHNSALGCVSSTTCGRGCDMIVSGRCSD